MTHKAGSAYNAVKTELLAWNYKIDLCKHFALYLKSLVQIELKII